MNLTLVLAMGLGPEMRAIVKPRSDNPMTRPESLLMPLLELFAASSGATGIIACEWEALMAAHWPLLPAARSRRRRARPCPALRP